MATTTTTTTTNPFANDDDDDDAFLAPSMTEENSAPAVRDFGIYNDDDLDDNGNDRRNGTISSARFNILSTMVGGGCLSLPLAFQQSGNAFVGPITLIVTGLVTDFCFRLLVASANHLDKINTNNTSASNDRQQQQQQQRSRNTTTNDRYSNLPPGKDTFESITSAAFGPKAYVFSMTLVVLMCFFGAVGYSVLLRDMMEPINDTLVDHLWGHNNNSNSNSNTTNSTIPPNSTTMSSFLVATPWEGLFASSDRDNAADGEYFYDYYFDADSESDDAATPKQQSWLQKNLTLFVVILLVTPFCTLRHLTALKDCGAASMTSVLILGSCIVFRSIQCNVNGGGSSSSAPKQPWYTYLTYFPSSWRELLDAVPLYISCFVCHYNILPVHNELQNPTPKRVSWWLRSTTWFAVTLYMIMGFAGSSYAHCTSTGEISGNVLLDFDENDPLLFVGRMCLAVTITLAFPMLVIPARDIMIRSWIAPMLSKRRQQQRQQQQQNGTTSDGRGTSQLQTVHEEGESDNNPSTTQSHSNDEEESELEQPLLSPDVTTDGEEVEEESVAHISFMILLLTSIVIFWTAGAVASCVESIDIVWDLLGSSLSILLSYLIPAGTYLVITARPVEVVEGMDDENGSGSSSPSNIQKWSRVLCWGLILFFFPLMVVSTANAVVNTFF
mmetsp:Transcript_52724/g.127801  ORF Transcript_52724/g.127801 Transcript_52724/m.127801 type:complete len:669 (-) Transcript_52724:195-2201(-)